jgi:hypothetical protein
MMSRLTTMMVFVGSLLVAGAVLAGEPPSEETPTSGTESAVPAGSSSRPSNGNVRYKAKTEIDFGERKVSGGLSGPMGVYAESLVDQQWNPLIRLRRNFDREILASTEGIR